MRYTAHFVPAFETESEFCRITCAVALFWETNLTKFLGEPRCSQG